MVWRQGYARALSISFAYYSQAKGFLKRTTQASNYCQSLSPFAPPYPSLMRPSEKQVEHALSDGAKASL